MLVNEKLLQHHCFLQSALPIQRRPSGLACSANSTSDFPGMDAVDCD
jgi:hypothetical protein